VHTGSLPIEDFKAQSKLLPNNPARQQYRHTTVTMEAAEKFIKHVSVPQYCTAHMTVIHEAI
jgi:hypothetical protein